MDKSKHLGIRIDNKVHYKLKYIATYNKRSINGQILFLINNHIRDFEKENGIIPFNSENSF